jgi:hypothetical protein
MRLAIALELSANDFKLPKIELRTTGWVELFVGALGSQAHPPFRTDEAGLAKRKSLETASRSCRATPPMQWT